MINDFEDWLLMKLCEAYLAARKGKRKTLDEHRFEVNDIKNLICLRDMIIERRYKPGRGIAFITKEPVTREIFAAPFVDRVVHHFLCDIILPWWEPRLNKGAYSCRKAKGTLYGIKDLEKNIRRCSQNYSMKTYVIKLDLEGYFMSLPREGLYRRVMWGLDRQFPEGGDIYRVCRYLWKEIIFDNPIKNVRIRGNKRDWNDLPSSKSLFYQTEGKGLVIGNLTSQVLSNIYLDQLDRFIVYDLGYKYYGRYVDDFYIIVTEGQLPQAKRDIKVIEKFLRSIGLNLHPKKRYVQDTRKGVDFLGVVVYPNHIVPGKRIKRNFRKAVNKFASTGEGSESITSYIGHMQHINSTKLIRKVFTDVGWEYDIDKGNLRGR